MRFYIETYRNAFRRSHTLSGKQLAKFLLYSIGVFALLMGLYLLAWQVVIYTPVIDYLTAPGVMQFSIYAVHFFQFIVLLPVVILLMKMVAAYFCRK
ncbi:MULTISPECIES: hypothetical protein [Kosakonia]|jgi:hypothetical protein|uniref:Uncharacterized protein n=1 Tax=Kosakonia sacchari TaxID=1158459 RepID=A0ABZ0MJJ2_9ENTR|nr:hypothetical protein [Kosakonia sacchari]WOZ75643.1 hypothetical protein Q8Y70_13540 [Kosakonia sacchari]